MKFSLRKYIIQLFICVILEKKGARIRTYTIRNNAIVHYSDKKFEFKEKALEYIHNLSQNFQVYYTAAFFDLQTQGVELGKSEQISSQFKLSSQELNSIVLNEANFFVDAKELQEQESNFEKYGGLDFSFNSLTLLCSWLDRYEFSKDEVVLGIFKYDTSLALIIKKGQKIVFGKFVDMNDKEEEKEDKEFDDFAQEYNFDNLDEFIDEKLDDLDINDEKQKLDDFASNMSMCNIIFQSIEEFYKDLSYESSFVNKMFIFEESETQVSKVILEYIEAELYIKPELVKIDILESMQELMLRELKV